MHHTQDRTGGTPTFFEQLSRAFSGLVDEKGLREADVSIRASILSPEEAIGSTKRKDYVLLEGKERLLEATVLGCKGQAFTSAQGDYEGTLDDVLSFPLTDDFQRAIYVATLNAIVRYTKLGDQTVHCRNEKLEACSQQVAAYFNDHHPASNILMIGYQPALAEALYRAGASLIVLDLDPKNIGRTRNGVFIQDGSDLDAHIAESDILFATGSTLCNGTIETLYASGLPIVLYGTTGAGAAALMGLLRFCPEAT